MEEQPACCKAARLSNDRTSVQILTGNLAPRILRAHERIAVNTAAILTMVVAKSCASNQNRDISVRGRFLCYNTAAIFFTIFSAPMNSR